MERRAFLAATAALGMAPSLGGTNSLRTLSQGNIQQNFVDLNGKQIHFWTAGSGPTLLLIHQSGNSSEEFAGLVPYLADHFHLVAPDLPGHGQSDDPDQKPTVDHYTEAVKSVIDYLGHERLVVLGHHGGALVAMNLVASEPERFTHTLLSGTSGLRSQEETEDFIKQLSKNKNDIRKDSDWIAKLWQRYQTMMSPGADIGDIYRAFLANLMARLRPYRAIFVYLEWDRRPALTSLRGPVLLMQGETDEFVSNQEQLLTLLPNSKRVLLPSCGTFMFYDKPRQCAEVIKNYLMG